MTEGSGLLAALVLGVSLLTNLYQFARAPASVQVRVVPPVAAASSDSAVPTFSGDAVERCLGAVEFRVKFDLALAFGLSVLVASLALSIGYCCARAGGNAPSRTNVAKSLELPTHPGAPVTPLPSRSLNSSDLAVYVPRRHP